MGGKMLAARYYGKEGTLAIVLPLKRVIAVDTTQISG